ncbi:Entericidin EcnA/B family protein [Roseovarius gaetbuli]|uniref:Entericidin EcnA/B family protein n=1 Tax=Roseovarius gaetbuli TaxID=1356575 RepID=A0A1X6ZWE2_9RHOB|nr:entericidin A/B family lipoprotein [Roseovarius gaetbuli]SLN63774.1 Entericidin EcnA/B family protein [Roseovarius gaetbuli]
MRMIALGLIAVLGLAGCETIQGAGRDIQNAGQTLEKAVN